MLSIGEFSKICEVTTKTLRYYEEIGLIYPAETNSENGYRFYTVDQLKDMLFINRLKAYHFSLDEIKELMRMRETDEERLFLALDRKKRELDCQIMQFQDMKQQILCDLSRLEQGKSIMAYMDEIEVQLVTVPSFSVVSCRKMVQKEEFSEQYTKSYNQVFAKISERHFTVSDSPMVLFHSNEFAVNGMDTEFAVPVKENTQETTLYDPGLCIKTVLHGSYRKLPSVYAKHSEWTEENGYRNNGPVFEVYVTDPSEIQREEDTITELYSPVIAVN